MAGRGTDIRLGGDPQGIMRSAILCLLMPYMTKGNEFFSFELLYSEKSNYLVLAHDLIDQI